MTVKDPQSLAEEREARFFGAMELKATDRVPFTGLGGDIVAAYGGISNAEYTFDYDLQRQATVKYLRDFPSDLPASGGAGIGNIFLSLAFLDFPDLSTSIAFTTGPYNDVLGVKFCRFPGRELPDNSSMQYLGGAYMEPKEYDELIADPVKFSYEKIVPRTSTNLENLSSPTALATMARLGIEMAKHRASSRALGKELAALGYPSVVRGLGWAPLDYIGDQLRDIPNLVLDLRRHPDKVKAAVEALMEPLLKMSLMYKDVGAKYIFIPLHLNEYLSPKLYNEFFWPTLKEIILKLFEAGLKSQVFFEGWQDPHLETILELPAGWGVAYFEKTDVRKAKKLLQGHTCIMGGIDVSDIISSTPAKLDQYVKELFAEMMPGGGFIFSPNIGYLPRETPIENVRAVYEAVEKYGKY
ncbi:MAG TPA: uroporphyrinogen decarboxylase family protein [Oscillospiraceae bacterium]|nr:uroporphyrinogen decarboxylase family protein [Oscillospiraceae bacterium]